MGEGVSEGGVEGMHTNQTCGWFRGRQRAYVERPEPPHRGREHKAGIIGSQSTIAEDEQVR
jgi:hypothetical protein